jgi:hypothetical protein
MQDDVLPVPDVTDVLELEDELVQFGPEVKFAKHN